MICPICKIEPLGTFTKHKTAKTCGKTSCVNGLRRLNKKPAKKYKRNIKDYNGKELCQCGNPARYIFSSGKICCQSVASNCPIIRIPANISINQKLRHDFNDQGINKLKERALKGAETKRTTINDDGQSQLELYGLKMKEYIASTRDENGRTQWSRCKLSDEEFNNRSEREKYYILVWNISNKSYYDNFYHLKDSSKRSADYHLDHIFSISEGFKHNIDPKIIGHISNLRIIPAKDNLSKYSKCAVTIEELMENYSLALERISSNV